MANYNSRFCAELKKDAPSEMLRYLKDELLELEEGDDLVGFELELDGTTAYLTCDENYNEEILIDYVQGFLKRFDLDDAVGIEIAHTCSRMVPDGFGGGAMVITKDDCRAMGTGEWIRQTINELKS